MIRHCKSPEKIDLSGVVEEVLYGVSSLFYESTNLAFIKMGNFECQNCNSNDFYSIFLYLPDLGTFIYNSSKING